MSQLSAEEARPVIAALTVSADEDNRRALALIFHEMRWKLRYSPCLAQARDQIDHDVIPVVICDAALPDGGWESFFRYTERLSPRPNFVVSSRLADERLWSEALNLGAYDVLSTPFDRREVAHVIRCAWDSWWEREHHTPSGKSKRIQRAEGGWSTKARTVSGGAWL